MLKHTAPPQTCRPNRLHSPLPGVRLACEPPRAMALPHRFIHRSREPCQFSFITSLHRATQQNSFSKFLPFIFGNNYQHTAAATADQTVCIGVSDIAPNDHRKELIGTDEPCACITTRTRPKLRRDPGDARINALGWCVPPLLVKL